MAYRLRPMSMMPGSQSVLDVVEAHLVNTIPSELQSYLTTVDDSLALAWRSPHEDRPWRTWSKRLLIDPVRLSVSDVAAKMSTILEQLPIAHEVLTTSGGREDVLSMAALAGRGSQRCMVNITYIQATERMIIHLIVATGVPLGTPLER